MLVTVCVDFVTTRMFFVEIQRYYNPSDIDNPALCDRKFFQTTKRYSHLVYVKIFAPRSIASQSEVHICLEELIQASSMSEIWSTALLSYKLPSIPRNFILTKYSTCCFGLESPDLYIIGKV